MVAKKAKKKIPAKEKIPAKVAKKPAAPAPAPAPPAPAKPPSPASASWKNFLLKNRQGVVPCVSNIVTILVNEPRWHGVLAFDEFTSQIVKIKPPPWHDDDKPAGCLTGPWNDEDPGRVAAWIAREWEATPTATLADQAVALVARKTPIHPVRDWLLKMKAKWDGKSRCDTWLLDFAGVKDSPYSRAVGPMFLIGAVARIFAPGCKVDHTLVLEGRTGVGKSTLLKDLVGEEWFLETEMDLGSKDFFQMLRGKWIVELAELDSLSRGELSRVKAVLTKTVDSYRSSYAKHSKDYPRQCVFTGTTEEDAYLKDEKGNRRFWPIAVTRVVYGAIKKVREQIWGEAVHRYFAGEKWHITDKELLAIFEAEQEQRRQVDPWESVIAEYLHGTRFVTRGVATSDIFQALGIKPKDQTRLEEMKVGAILKKLGWDRVRIRMYGDRTYLYRPKDPAAWGIKKSGPPDPTKPPPPVANIADRLRRGSPKGGTLGPDGKPGKSSRGTKTREKPASVVPDPTGQGRVKREVV